MIRYIAVHVVIYAALFSLIIISILDAPEIPQDAFGVAVITWIFYEVVSQKVEIVKLHDEIKEMKREVMLKWQSISSQKVSK